MKTDNTNTTKKTEKVMSILFIGVWLLGIIAIIVLNIWVF